MPFNGNGTYNTIGGGDFPAVAGELVRSEQYNNQINDMATALSNCMTRDGQSPPTAHVSMGGKRLTNLGSAAAGGDACTLLQAQEIFETAVTAQAPGQNLLDNSAFWINQRTGRSATAGVGTQGFFGPDRWGMFGLLSQYTCQTDAGQLTTARPTPYTMTVKKIYAPTYNAFLTQIIPVSRVVELAGGNVTVSFDAKLLASASDTNLRVYLFSGSGVGSVPWKSEGLSYLYNWYNGAGSTWANLLADYVDITLSGTAANYTATFAVPAGSKELAVGFLYTATTTGGGSSRTNDGFSISAIKLEKGSVATAWGVEDFFDALRACLPYYQKSFELTTTPAQNVGTLASHSLLQVVGASTTQRGCFIPFEARMLYTNPTVTFYNPGAASAQAYNVTRSASCTSTTIIGGLSNLGIEIVFTTPAGSSSGDEILVHWSADAEEY